jgi:hypothetical protein
LYKIDHDSRVVFLIGRLFHLQQGNVMFGHGGNGDCHIFGLYLEREQQSNWSVSICLHVGSGHRQSGGLEPGDWMTTVDLH